MPKYLTTKYGIHSATLGRWADAGKFEVRWMQGGKRLYPLAAVQKLLGEPEVSEAEVRAQQRVLFYARVGSDKQRLDLERQIHDLRTSYPDTEIISDVGSGLN